AVREPIVHPGTSSGNTTRKIAREGERCRTDTHLGSSIPWKDETGFRNRRTVWRIPTRPLRALGTSQHFAVFPEALVEPCILAGTSKKGVCAICGAPPRRVTCKGDPVQVQSGPGTQKQILKSQNFLGEHGATSVFKTGHVTPQITTHWEPTCSCCI